MAAILKNVKCNICAAVWPILDEIDTVMFIGFPNLASY